MVHGDRGLRAALTTLAAATGTVALSLAGLMLLPQSASAATSTYYVSTQGSDYGSGTRTRPWRTIQNAVRQAPSGSTITVAGGSYAPFTVTRSGQTVVAASGQSVVVQGAAGVQDVIRVAAANVKLLNLTVAGCVPDPKPNGSFEDAGSSGVRINDGATNATVQGLTIRDSHGVNPDGLAFGCYGILVHNADQSHLIGNDISGNGAGIFFNGGGRYAEVTNNKVHDNDVLVRNTPGGNDDFGGTAIAFDNLTASPGPTATGNVLSGNAGVSSDYGFDGGGFDIYNASNLRISGNTLSNNENVLETGTSPGGACANNTFTGNTVTGRPPSGRLTKSVGVILRCATGMLVDSNSFLELDWWIFVIDTGDEFSSGVKGLRITNNTVNQWQKVYHLAVDPVADQVTVDRNKFHFTGPIFASYADGTTSSSLADWRLRSGLDLTSTTY